MIVTMDILVGVATTKLLDVFCSCETKYQQQNNISFDFANSMFSREIFIILKWYWWNMSIHLSFSIDWQLFALNDSNDSRNTIIIDFNWMHLIESFDKHGILYLER